MNIGGGTSSCSACSSHRLCGILAYETPFGLINDFALNGVFKLPSQRPRHDPGAFKTIGSSSTLPPFLWDLVRSP